MGKLVRYDVKEGIFLDYIKYLILIIIFSIMSIVFIKTVMNFTGTGTIVNKFSIGDLLMYWFKGMKEYNTNENIPFDMPAQYIVLGIFLAFLIGDYPVKDLNGFGKDILVRTKKRDYWWNSKCIWNFLTVLIFYSILFGIMLVICLLYGNLSLSPNIDISNRLCGLQLKPDYIFPMHHLILGFFVLPILTSLALSFLQMTLSLLFNSFISYMCIISILVASAFYKSDFLIGNYLMVKRYSWYKNGGIHELSGVLMCISIIVLSYLIGMFYFKLYDIYNRKKEE